MGSYWSDPNPFRHVSVMVRSFSIHWVHVDERFFFKFSLTQEPAFKRSRHVTPMKVLDRSSHYVCLSLLHTLVISWYGPSVFRETPVVDYNYTDDVEKWFPSVHHP